MSQLGEVIGLQFKRNKNFKLKDLIVAKLTEMVLNRTEWKENNQAVKPKHFLDRLYCCSFCYFRMKNYLCPINKNRTR